jgi:hypothetical protein
MDATSIRRMDPKIVKRISDLMPWAFSEYSEHGISYHTCRFCGQGSESNEGLWKYGVRHYVCIPCRDAITRTT